MRKFILIFFIIFISGCTDCLKYVSTFEIDECEYNYYEDTIGNFEILHKNDCKYCKQRLKLENKNG